MNRSNRLIIIFLGMSPLALALQDPFKPCEEQFCRSQYMEATSCYERMFPAAGSAEKEHIVRARLNYAETLLGQGDYINGFRLLDERLAYRAPLQKPWDGSNPQGKTILVRCEQGLGDTFFFLRYAWALKAFGAKVIVLVQGPLKPAVSGSPFIDLVINGKDPVPAFDYDVYIMSLPRYIEHDKKAGVIRLSPTTVDTVPAFGPYMHANAAVVNQWIAKLPVNKFKIGICWRASALPAGQVRMLERDIPLALLGKIATIPGVAVFNLLAGFHEPIRQSDALANADVFNVIPDNYPTIYSFDNFDKAGPFVDTMALIANMDLVISVDTSVPNLAGAMGKPVWFLLPAESDWRWGQGPRNDSVWHSSARLFWQQKQGDWSNVMNDVMNALQQIVK